MSEASNTAKNPPYTGSAQLIGYKPEGYPLWQRVLWYVRHPRTMVRRRMRRG